MHIVMTFADGTEVWYTADDIKIVPDPYGMAAAAASVIPGAPQRPAGPYVEIRNATLARVAGVPV